MEKLTGVVSAVSLSGTHTFSKSNQESIQLLEGLGVEGDAHLGKTVKRRSRIAKDPTQPNLRQVHLIHSELFDELQAAGSFASEAGPAYTDCEACVSTSSTIPAVHRFLGSEGKEVVRFLLSR